MCSSDLFWCSMEGVVELRCNGISLEKSKCLGQRESEDSAVKTAKLCRHKKKRAEFRSRRLCLSESVTDQRSQEVRSQRQLAPRYIGPYQILSKRGEVAYQLSLPENLSAVHDVFHVSQLKKCLRVLEEQLPVEGLEVQEDLTYVEKPAQILEIADRVTRRNYHKVRSFQTF